MPARNERHARTKGADWGTNPSRSTELKTIVSTEDALGTGIIPVGPKGKSRKNTVNWCRGVEGHAHAPEITYRQGISTPAQIEKACGWRWKYNEKAFEYHYACGHQESCANCGKVLRSRSGWQMHAGKVGDQECPRYDDLSKWQVTEMQEAWEAWRVQYAERMTKWRARRRKVIAGPSHYRKK